MFRHHIERGALFLNVLKCMFFSQKNRDMIYLLGVHRRKHIYVSLPVLQTHINLFAEITEIRVKLQNPFIFSYNDISGELKGNV
jgi:hypothetical protein